MSWLYLALMAPVFWSLSNVIDKFAIKNITSHYISFIFLLSIGNVFFFVLIFLVMGGLSTSSTIVAINIISGLAIFMQYFTYSYVLEDMDVSVVIPIHQSEPIFVLVISILLFNAIPSEYQIGGFFAITLGILILSFSSSTISKIPHNKKILILISSSSFFRAVSIIMSDELLKGSSLNSVLAYNFLGYALGGILLLLIPSWRKIIKHDLVKMKKSHFSVFALTNIFDVTGYVFFIAALSYGGSASMVSIIVGIHPAIIIVLGYIITKFFPDIYIEDIEYKSMIKKIVSFLFIILGVYLISLS